MRNLLFTISFDGEAYHGWQIQENAVSVQGIICDAWKKLTSENAVINGCSRTDAFVHALEYKFSVKTECTIPEKNFPAALMSKLPESIAVYDCVEMPSSFHARFDCTSKEYEYRISNTEVLSPFLAGRACLYKYKLDENLLNEAAKDFCGTHDFSAFCASGSSVGSKVRTVKKASVIREGDMVIFRVEADGFLYNMVRIMVGTLFGIAEGKISNDTVPEIISSLDREKAGVTAPPQGLYLKKVSYERDKNEA